MPIPEINKPDNTGFKCGDKVFVLADGKITESRINAKNTLDRLFEGSVKTVYEYKVDGIDAYVMPDKDFFKSKDDLLKSLS